MKYRAVRANSRRLVAVKLCNIVATVENFACPVFMVSSLLIARKQIYLRFDAFSIYWPTSTPVTS